MKKRVVSALVFLVIKISKNINCMCEIILSKYILIYLLWVGEESKRHYVLIKDINTIAYDHTLIH